jgi:hypothetical protein
MFTIFNISAQNSKQFTIFAVRRGILKSTSFSNFRNFSILMKTFLLSEMKNHPILLMILCIFMVSSCNSKKKSDEIKNYAYKQETSVFNSELQSRLGDWVEEGTVCWGLVVSINREGIVIKGLPVKAKVISLQKDSIKMKALEMVSLTEIKGCTKMGLSKGETWWETEGDLFKTKEEAESYLKKKGWVQ